jgi:hypothetical protein
MLALAAGLNLLVPIPIGALIVPIALTLLALPTYGSYGNGGVISLRGHVCSACRFVALQIWIGGAFKPWFDGEAWNAKGFPPVRAYEVVDYRQEM